MTLTLKAGPTWDSFSVTCCRMFFGGGGQLEPCRLAEGSTPQVLVLNLLFQLMATRRQHFPMPLSGGTQASSALAKGMFLGGEPESTVPEHTPTASSVITSCPLLLAPRSYPNPQISAVLRQLSHVVIRSDSKEVGWKWEPLHQQRWKRRLLKAPPAQSFCVQKA